MEYPIKALVVSKDTGNKVECFILGEVKKPQKDGYVIMCKRKEIEDKFEVNNIPSIDKFIYNIYKQNEDGDNTQMKAMSEYSHNDYIYIAEQYMGSQKDEVCVGVLNKKSDNFNIVFDEEYVETKPLTTRLKNLFKRNS